MKMNIKELEKWTNAFGPSGFEIEVARLVKEYATPFADEVLQDSTLVQSVLNGLPDSYQSFASTL